MTEKNLSSIRELALAFLYLEIKEDFDGLLCNHPFTDAMYVACNGKTFVDLHDPAAQDMWREEVKKRISTCRSYRDFTILITKSYRFAWFKFSLPYLTAEEMAEFLLQNWKLLEFPSKNKNISPTRLIHILKKLQNTEVVRQQKEQLDHLPDLIKIYRGCGKKEKTPKGLSWTLSKEVASWFAKRFDKDGHIFSGVIQKEDILLCFLDSEQEILCDPKTITEIKKEAPL